MHQIDYRVPRITSVSLLSKWLVGLKVHVSVNWYLPIVLNTLHDMLLNWHED